MKKILVILAFLFTNSFGMEREPSDLSELLSRGGVRLGGWKFIRVVDSDFQTFEVEKPSIFSGEKSKKKYIFLAQIGKISLESDGSFGREKYTETEFIQLMVAFSVIQRKVTEINWSGKIERPLIFFSTLKKFEQLERVNLNYTELESIPEDAFAGLDDLQVIDLLFNKRLTGLPQSLYNLNSIEMIMWDGDTYYSKHGKEIWSEDKHKDEDYDTYDTSSYYYTPLDDDRYLQEMRYVQRLFHGRHHPPWGGRLHHMLSICIIETF